MTEFSGRIAALSPKRRALLAQRLRAEAKVAGPPAIPRRQGGEAVRLFSAQERLWFLDRWQPGSTVYNLLQLVRLTGRLDVPALAASLRELVRRHESLRSVFVESQEGPFQVVTAVTPETPVIDLSSLPELRRRSTARALAGAEGRIPFDLARGPLFRSRLLRLGEEEHFLVLALHHIVADLWSFGVILRDVGALYDRILSGPLSPLPELPIQYADFAAWHRAWFAGEVLEGQLSYWREQLSGAPFFLELPVDRPRPAVQSSRGELLPFTLPASLLDSLRDFGQTAGATLFMVSLAAFSVLLERYSGKDDFLVGSPIAGRTRPELGDLVGLFVNTLVLRADLSGHPSFLELLARVRETTLGAFSHQDLPFERLVQELQPERNMSRTPLVQVTFAFQSAPVQRLELPGLTLAPFDLDRGTAMFDLGVFLAESEGTGVGMVEANSDLFDRTRIQRLVGHFQGLLEAVSAEPGRRLSELSLLSLAERQQLLWEWTSDAPASLSRGGLAFERFVAQAAAAPLALAVVAPEGRLTYGELAARAGGLAARLQRLGVGPEVVVGIALPRSLDLVVAIIAVAQAGGAYLPLDPDYPRERLAFMLEDSEARALLTRRELATALAGSVPEVVCLDDPAPPAAAGKLAPASLQPESLAYVIYTSGSTGRPKGVTVPHGGLLNLVLWHNRIYGVTTADRASQVAGPSFDASTWEIWPPLVAGASLHLPGEELRTAAPELLAWLAAERISLAFLPTPLAESVLRLPVPPGLCLRELLTGGDRLRRLPQGTGLLCPVVNHYGPTEATVVATASPVSVEEDRDPTIGRPIAGVRVCLLTSRLQPVPVGVAGELVIGGAGLARGYIGRPELTAERFVPDPFSPEPGGRLYRSGDLARYLPNGDLLYLERIDHQVKIRGFRIELGEIEAVLSQHPGIQQAVVGVHGAGSGQRLVAYLVPVGLPAPASGELRELLRAKLPDHMIPSAFLPLAALPLTLNGKIDRHALARLAPESVRTEAFVAPRTALEELLVGIWAEVLHREPDGIGVEDNFFELGGSSLSTTRIASRLREVCGVEVALRRLFEAPTIAGLAAEVEAARRSGIPVAPPIPVLPRPERPTLSFAQERLWVLDQLDPGSAAYNIPGALEVRGVLDVEALGASLAEIVRRHEVLRTTFRSEGGIPLQVIRPGVDLPFPVIDLRTQDSASRQASLRRLAADDAARPFDLAHGPVLRATLVRMGDDVHVVLVAMHHIASDGWSLGILVRELAALYDAFIAGAPSPLPALSIQYADYAAWQRQWLRDEVLAAQLAFWRERLTGVPQALDLPTDRPRPAVQTWNGAVFRFTLPGRLASELKLLGRASGATLFMVLLAAWETLLHHTTGQERLLVGSPVAGRTRREVEGLIGFFVNTLILRADLPGEAPFTTILAGAREMSLGAFTHQDLPFEKLVEVLQPERDPARSPLVQSLFAFQNGLVPRIERPGLTFIPLELDSGTAKFEVSLALFEDGGELAGALEYNTDLFDGVRIERLAGHLRELLSGVVAEPGRWISDLPLLSAAERQQLLAEWNDTAASYPPGICLHELFEAQAERAPDALAVRFGEEELTYRDLDLASNRLAHWLRANGVGPEGIVGVLLDRSIEMVVALFGVLKAGGAYLPLDPSYPKDRLSFFVADAAPRLVLTTSALADRLPAASRRVCLDADGSVIAAVAAASGERPAPQTGPDHLAYVIYTSGSTGRPKGAMNAHRGIVNRILWMQEAYRLGPTDRVLQKTPFSFDVSVWELFWPLAVGARLVMAMPDGHRDPAYLTAVIAREGITTLHFVPSMLRAFLEAEAVERCTTVRQVMASGEELTAEIGERFRQRLGGAELHNLYGPTEAAVDVTSWPCHRERGRTSLPIGRPIANLRIHLLDRTGLPVPLGIPGELHIGGAGVGRGYLGRPELTAERFVPDPWSREPGGRLYRTGDLARHRADGAVDFLGRIDHQVKIRGYRIELGEIEAALSALAAIREAVVMARDYGPGDRRLVAYTSPVEGAEISPEAVREALRRSLPEALIPGAFVLLETLPLNPNGKVDRPALARIAPDGSAGSSRPYTAPESVVEQTLAEIWADLLKTERVSIHDSFFELGGHSLLATQLASRVRESFGVEVPLRVVFEAPTIARFAAEVLARQVAAQDEAELERLLAELEELPEGAPRLE